MHSRKKSKYPAFLTVMGGKRMFETPVPQKTGPDTTGSLMANKDTVERILDSAEILFAERGFAETSLRTITSAAGVNLAAVNYHFGSKKALIQAVFVRFTDPLVDALHDRLHELEARGGESSLEELLGIVATTMLSVQGRDPSRTATFMRLLGLAYTQSQGHLRNYLKERYGRIYARFLDRLRHACNDLDDTAMFWNTHFALGAAVFTMSNYESLQAMLHNLTGGSSGIDDAIHRLVPFLAAGMLGRAGAGGALSGRPESGAAASPAAGAVA